MYRFYNLALQFLANFFIYVNLLLLLPKKLAKWPFKLALIWTPLQIQSNPPIYIRNSAFYCSLKLSEHWCRTFSISSIVKVSSNKPHFNSKSSLVLAVMEGLLLISNSHGLRFLSRRISNPYNSKQCLSLMMTFWTAINDYTINV